MDELIFKTGDYVYEGTTVPDGLVISEKFDEENHRMTITYSYSGTPSGMISFSGICENDPLFSPLTREQMRKMIVSGFIEYFRNRNGAS